MKECSDIFSFVNTFYKKKKKKSSQVIEAATLKLYVGIMTEVIVLKRALGLSQILKIMSEE